MVRRLQIACGTAPVLPLPARGADLCTFLPEGITMPDTVEFGETAPHGKGAGRAFRRAGAFPAAEAGDDPGSPGEGPWGMGIFLPGSASFILELKGGEEFDLVGVEEVAGGLRHLAVAGADQSHDATRCSSGDDRELHQSVGSFQLAGFNVYALAFHHPDQLLDRPAQPDPSHHPPPPPPILAP